jgi:nucleotide-binding universal stress UspA family protein
MRMVVAVDGSDIAARAVRHVVKLAALLKQAPQIHVLNADEPLLRSVAIELGVEGVARYHRENGQYAVKKATAILKRADLDFETHLLVGDPAETILSFAKSSKCDLIVMGSHGRGAFRSLFLGSVASKVLAHSQTPLTIVR